MAMWRHRRTGRMPRENTKTGAICLQAKERLGPVELEETRKDPSLQATEEQSLLTSWFQISSLQNYESTNLCCFKPLVPGTSYSSPGKLTHRLNPHYTLCGVGGSHLIIWLIRKLNPMLWVTHWQVTGSLVPEPVSVTKCLLVNWSNAWLGRIAL